MTLALPSSFSAPYSHSSALVLQSAVEVSPPPHQASPEVGGLVQRLSSEARIPVLGCNVAP